MSGRDERNKRLRENYKKLRAAGFSSAEATRYRNAKPEHIEAVIRARKLPPKDPFRSAYGAGRKKETVKPEQAKKYQEEIKTFFKPKKDKDLPEGFVEIKGRIVYQDAKSHPLVKYLSNYTYVIAYQVKHKDGTKEWKAITFTSPKKMTKAELWDSIENEIFNDPAKRSRYDSTVIRSSYTLIGAYEKR